MPMLAHETTTAAAEALSAASVAVVPVGSTEQHGPALPLGMDHLAATAFASHLGERDDAVVLPPIPVGVSPHHMQFHGSLTVSDETFERYVTETVESVTVHGVRKAVIVNGHGGNVPALRRMARRLRADRTAFAPTWNWWESVEDLADDCFDEVGGHADAAESSLIWHLHESLVRPEALADAEAGGADGWGRSVHGAAVGFDTVDFTDSGAVGKPSQADPEAGTQLFEAACAELEALVEWVGDRPLEDCWQREHV